MSLKGTRTLLTGGTGFIGSRVASALAKEGAELTLLVRKTSTGERLGPLWTKAKRVVADLDDPKSLAKAVKQADPELVVHLAKTPGAPFEQEAKATAALAAALSGAPHVKRWVRTAHAAGERGPAADRELARALAIRHSLSVVTLELYLVYGPGMNAGEPARALVEDALAGKPLYAPDEAKDLVFVDDVAKAYVLAATRPVAQAAWLSIGGGRLVPGMELAQSAAKAAKSDSSVAAAYPPRDGGEPADLRPAEAVLGWKPETPLDKGMLQLAQWLQKGTSRA